MKPSIGILGGGQLGRMLIQSGIDLNARFFVLEKGHDFPCASICEGYQSGDLMNFDDVLEFGKDKDILTIEIEHVNVEALRRLQALGKRIIPDPGVLELIQDKGQQKEFYLKNNIPTSAFRLTTGREDVLKLINDGAISFPFVVKLRKGGYDGKGVELIRDASELNKVFDAPSVVEEMIDLSKEIAVIVACDDKGACISFPAVEMVFDPKLNLVDYLISPASISESLSQQAEALAIRLAKAFGSAGLFAVEMFVDKNDKVLVNEVAPRAHNSGHHSIEGNFTSQFEQQVRILLNYPLGNTDILSPALMLNLIGEAGFSGPALYQGIDEVMQMKGVYIHLYGKTDTKAGRKMGHVTILAKNRDELIEKAQIIKERMKVLA